MLVIETFSDVIQQNGAQPSTTRLLAACSGVFNVLRTASIGTETNRRAWTGISCIALMLLLGRPELCGTSGSGRVHHIVCVELDLDESF